MLFIYALMHCGSAFGMLECVIKMAVLTYLSLSKEICKMALTIDFIKLLDLYCTVYLSY